MYTNPKFTKYTNEIKKKLTRQSDLPKVLNTRHLYHTGAGEQMEEYQTSTAGYVYKYIFSICIICYWVNCMNSFLIESCLV